MGISLNASFDELIQFVHDCAETARRLGVLAMPDKFGEIDDDFMKYAIKLVADGYPPKQVRSVFDMNTAVMLKLYESKLKMFCEAIRSIQAGEHPSKIKEDCEKWRIGGDEIREMMKQHGA